MITRSHEIITRFPLVVTIMCFRSSEYWVQQWCFVLDIIQYTVDNAFKSNRHKTASSSDIM